MKYTNKMTALLASCLLIATSTVCKEESDDVAALLALAAAAGANQPRFVFSGGEPGSENLYTVNADGSDLKQITFDNAGDRMAEWSPDGSKIAFGSSNRDGIWIVNSDGSGLTQLTTVADETMPTFAPDGRIVFQSRNRYHINPDIVIMDADGSNITRLTNNTGWDQMPDVSPDGSRIVFYTDRDGDTEIYTIAIDGSDPQRVTNKTEAQANAIYSMDGGRIFYTESGATLWAKTDGSDEQQVYDSAHNGLSQCLPGILYTGGMITVDLETQIGTEFPSLVDGGQRYANCYMPQ